MMAMSASVVWNAGQNQVLNTAESMVVVGGPGSGKTAVLQEKARRAQAAGHTVQLLTFGARVAEFLKSDKPTYAVSTMVEAAAAQLVAHGVPVKSATNNQMRQLLRQLMPAQSFQGTLAEAEHIVRAAKSRAKKLPENDRYFPFVKAYQQQLESQGLLDRHDIIRRHVLAMRENAVPPLKVTWLLVDTVQDITELQLIWLQQHMAHGVKVVLAVDDDTTAYGRDGAMGHGVLASLEAMGVPQVVLPQGYRMPTTLAPVYGRMARQLRQRAPKPEATASTRQGAVVVEMFAERRAEQGYVVERCRALAARGETVGVITRTDAEANHMVHVLQKQGLNPASYARLVWEEPTPQLVLAVLYMLVGQARAAHVQLVVLGLGVPWAALPEASTLENWLEKGAPWPLAAGSSPTTQMLQARIRQAFRGAYMLWSGQHMPPRDIFKALVADVLPLLPVPEQESALLAADMLVGLGGKLAEVLPRIQHETMPDMASLVTVAPVREVRGRAFRHVVMPFMGASSWPLKEGPLLPAEPDHERRLWLLACSRAEETLMLTGHEPTQSPFVAELQQALAMVARKGA